MKRYFIGVIVLVAILTTACVKNSHTDYSPRMSVSYFIKNPNVLKDSVWGNTAADTLKLEHQEDGSYLLPEIDINDTVFFAVGCTSFMNDLISLSVKVDTSEIQLFSRIDMKPMAGALTNPDEMKTFHFQFKTGYNYVQIPVFYRVLKGGDRRKIELVLEADSKYSPVNATIWQRTTTNVHGGQ